MIRHQCGMVGVRVGEAVNPGSSGSVDGELLDWRRFPEELGGGSWTVMVTPVKHKRTRQVVHVPEEDPKREKKRKNFVTGEEKRKYLFGPPLVRAPACSSPSFLAPISSGSSHFRDPTMTHTSLAETERPKMVWPKMVCQSRRPMTD